jgi:hypothetical protein
MQTDVRRARGLRQSRCERLIASAATCGDFRTQPLDGCRTVSRIAAPTRSGRRPRSYPSCGRGRTLLPSHCSSATGKCAASESEASSLCRESRSWAGATSHFPWGTSHEALAELSHATSSDCPRAGRRLSLARGGAAILPRPRIDVCPDCCFRRTSGRPSKGRPRAWIGRGALARAPTRQTLA